MAYETIKYDVAEQILTVTLNRPDKLNAFNAQMQAELIDAFDAADKDDNVRAIIVTGAGRGFCAGADLSSGADTFDRDARRGPVKRFADGKVDYSDSQVRDCGGQVTLRIFKCLKQPRAGSCRASSASRRRWSGAIRAVSSRRRKRSPDVSSARWWRRMISC